MIAIQTRSPFNRDADNTRRYLPSTVRTIWNEREIGARACSHKRRHLRGINESPRHRYESIQVIRRTRREGRRARMGRQGKPSLPKGDSAQAQSKQERPMDREDAATKIQRTYRAHRAVKVLNDLEARIVGAFEPPNDSRSALTFLRARSAELAAVRAFMCATHHVSENQRVKAKLHRVSEILRRSLERAKHEQEQQELGSVVVHVHEVDRGSEHDHDTVFPTSICDSPKNNGKLDLHDKWRTSSAHLPVISEEEVDLSAGSDEDDERRKVAIANLSEAGPDQRKEWIEKILAATPRRRARRHPTVSKVPALLTILEVPETSA